MDKINDRERQHHRILQICVTKPMKNEVRVFCHRNVHETAREKCYQREKKKACIINEQV